MIVTFCGHGKLMYDEETENRLKDELERLIKGGADTFYLGGYGRFDALASGVLTELKEKYPQIKRILVIPYLNRDYYLKNYDETLYPPLESVPYKFCISKRNEWMAKNADVVICFKKLLLAVRTRHINMQKITKKPLSICLTKIKNNYIII